MLATDDVSHAGEHLAVLEAYRMFANDRGWLRRMQDAVRTGLTAEAAVESVNNAMRARLGGDAIFICVSACMISKTCPTACCGFCRVGRNWLRRQAAARRRLVARTMGPAELLDYDRRKLRGLILEEGAMGAHVAIVARALNVPMMGSVRGIADIAAMGRKLFWTPTKPRCMSIRRQILSMPIPTGRACGRAG